MKKHWVTMGDTDRAKVIKRLNPNTPRAHPATKGRRKCRLSRGSRRRAETLWMVC